jgi:hypothetical protein
MPMTQSDSAKVGFAGAPYPDAHGEVIAKRFTKTVVAGDLALNNIIEMAVIPGNCRVVDMVLNSDDLDSNGTPLLAMDVGVMSGNTGENNAARTCGQEFFVGSVAAQTGVSQRMSAKTGWRVAPVESQRSIGVKITAAPATFAAGSLELIVWIAADNG